MVHGLEAEPRDLHKRRRRVYSRPVPPSEPRPQPPTQGQILGLLILTAVLGLHTVLTVW